MYSGLGRVRPRDRFPGVRPMKNYIVRIYRDKKVDHRDLVGVVEEVGRPGRRAFTNFDELREILIPRAEGFTSAVHTEGVRHRSQPRRRPALHARRTTGAL